MSFKYIDGILSYIKIIIVDRYYCNIYNKDHYFNISYYRDKIITEYKIIKIGHEEYIEKEKIPYITMYLEDMIMNSKHLNDKLKDDICLYICKERKALNIMYQMYIID